MKDPGAVFGALADANRRRLLELLAARGSATATELARELPVTRQAVAKHLAALDEAGLVVRAREGRETRYRVTAEALGDAVSWLTETGARWDTRLGSLQTYLAQRRPPAPG